MIIHLPEDLESSIRSLVQGGRYASEDEVIAEAVRSFLGQRQDGQEPDRTPAAKEGTAPAHKPIWEVFQEIARSVPPETWDDLPADLSDQHDHYIYGTPKRTDA
jgi:Arc/MetJ-type ribon-helix-helix transcriptional regulator